MKRYLTSLIIREMQIKTTRYYLTPVGVTFIKKTRNNKRVREDEERGNPLALCSD